MIEMLRQRNFALLWFGSLVSLVGDWVLMIGLPIYVYLLTGSVLATSLMLLASSIPGVALSSVAGVLVDRWDRQRTLIITNVLLAIGLLPLLLVRSPDRAWVVYVVAFVESCLARFASPAQSSWVPDLVGEQHLVSANSLTSLSQSLARLGGPAIGGVVAAIFGLSGLVLFDAVSFLAAAALIAAIAAPTGRRSVRAPIHDGSAIARLVREWLDGLQFIVANRTLSVLVVAVASLGQQE